MSDITSLRYVRSRCGVAEGRRDQLEPEACRDISLTGAAGQAALRHRQLARAQGRRDATGKVLQRHIL
jgi:hypothetical protein